MQNHNSQEMGKKIVVHLTKARKPDIYERWCREEKAVWIRLHSTDIINTFIASSGALWLYVILSATFVRPFSAWYNNIASDGHWQCHAGTLIRCMKRRRPKKKWKTVKFKRNEIEWETEKKIPSSMKNSLAMLFQVVLVILIAHVALLIFFVIRKQSTQR